ncbi:hypothetical protein [Gordonia rhizosphera]|uniref:AbiEi antitoxin C-terminal domain-containing protein n=1 Tax=Gordonia rhizosphera NBRC 16068 TaxID=1108045 RepID=K6W031_9ACTN|nr:hypothetical protein [Gordonia rhizosphera]GAB92520.1 hypothetical protein GORHZ_182_00230 [Gordonia rhizosphera NBRC 16068]
MATYPTDRYGLIRREATLARGISDAQIATAVRKKDLLRLTPGVCVENSGTFEGHKGADKLYRLRSIAVATSELLGERALPLSHQSAAAVHGLALLKPDRSRVHVSTGRAAGGSVRKHRHLHAGLVAPDEIIVVDGIRVTSVERTAVDIAAAGDFAQALTVFDTALRAGADRGLMEQLLKTRRRNGIQRAFSALSAADPLSESVGESWSRAQMIEAGLPVPRLQHTYRCGSKKYQTDYDSDDRMVGEFDGKKKYLRLRRPGESIEEAVMREKVREDELRALGLMVIRWTWAVLERHGLVELLRPWLVRLGIIAR